ncbi:MAG: 30S ribosome-binding factor RbfA [Ignavibacteria bacterium]|nr:30S ribosome-binding factor RbfA [Ignavibacteria bacterium]
MAYRVEKVSEEIRQKMNIAMSKDLAELNLGIVTVSKVILSPDLKNAKIYVTFIGNKEPYEKCIDKLNYRKKHIRYMLGKELTMKFIPEIHFYYDDTLDTAERIFKILNDLRKSESSE